MQPPFIGGSYQLESRPASVQRTVNMVPVQIEPGNERAGWGFEDVPGLRRFNPAEEPGPGDSGFEYRWSGHLDGLAANASAPTAAGEWHATMEEAVADAVASGLYTAENFDTYIGWSLDWSSLSTAGLVSDPADSEFLRLHFNRYPIDQFLTDFWLTPPTNTLVCSTLHANDVPVSQTDRVWLRRTGGNASFECRLWIVTGIEPGESFVNNCTEYPVIPEFGFPQVLAIEDGLIDVRRLDPDAPWSGWEPT